MDFKKYLCAQLKKYNDVFIYGYGDIGICVLDYIIDLETNIKIANYSGKVKYFVTSDKSNINERKEKKGIKIKSIYDLKEYAKKALIIIATQEKHHNVIESILDELEFCNRIKVLHEDYCILRETVENHTYIIENNLQQYHLNHQIKLNRLREKISHGGKAKVFFMTHDSAVFGGASIYREMEKSDIFDPYIFCVSRRDVTYSNFYEDILTDVKFFENRGYQVINGYDEMKNPKDLHLYNPDIIFYDIPKLYGAAESFYYRLEHLNWEYLTCYIPYGLLMVDSFYYHYHTKCIRESWKFFLDTNASFKRVLADGAFCGFNTIMAGYPKFDDYFLENVNIPQKIDNNHPIVIYAPHHSLFASNNFATFDLYKDFILDIVKRHPEINFVFKPHPLLPFQIRARAKEKLISFSYKDYEEYVEEWDSLPNGICIIQGDYIGLFRKSKCLITDCGSFIGEYFPSGNPCIYMFNPRKKNQDEVYTQLANRILDTYYIARNASELQEYIKQVIIQGIDIKKDNRKKILDEEFKNIGKSGEFICNYIKKQIKPNMEEVW